VEEEENGTLASYKNATKPLRHAVSFRHVPIPANEEYWSRDRTN